MNTDLLIATNTENLKSFITTGLIFPKVLFQKYYKDISEKTPDYIPIFIDSLPDSWIFECKEEADINVAIISLDIALEKIEQNILFYRNASGQIINGAPENYSDAQTIYYKGLLPVSIIKNVLFESDDSKKKFLDYPYSKFKPEIFNLNSTKSNQKYFKQNHDESLLDSNNIENNSIVCNKEEIQHSVKAYLESNARGGLIAMMLYALPDVPESRNLVKSIMQPLNQDSNINLSLLPKQMQYIKHWIWNESVQLTDWDTILLWHLMDILASLDCDKGLTSSTFLTNLQHDLDNTINTLDISPSIKIKYDEFKQRFGKIYESIQNTVDQTVDPAQFFNDSSMKSKVIRALVLFLIRKDDIKDFHTERSLVKEWAIAAEDLLFANLLYGVWKGWDFLDEKFIPTDKKDRFTINSFIADFYNRIYMKTPTSFCDRDSLNITKDYILWEKKILKNVKWQIKHKLGEVALYLAKKRDWNVVESKIVFSQANLLNFSYERNGNISIKVSDDVLVDKIIDRSIDREKFLQHLENIELDDEEIEQFSKIQQK